MRSERAGLSFTWKTHGVLLLVSALLTAAGGCSLPPDASPGSATATPPPPSTSTPTTIAPTSSATPTPTPTIQALDAQVLEQMLKIENQVIQLRGLRPTSSTFREVLTAQELAQEVMDMLQEDYTPEEAADEARVLAMLGLIEPGLDLWRLYLDLYAEQVLGFYDNESEQMTVLSDDDFDILERLTYAHEYNHALQDQAYDFEDTLNWNEEDCEMDGDRCLAIQSLIEGDATLLQSQWLRTYASMSDLSALLDLSSTLDTAVFSSAPEFIQQSLFFPYDQGASFVEYIYLRGQWAAVDEVYVNPPSSTEQILHPHRYPDELPITLELPELENVLPAAWREIDRSTLGEWQLRQFLAQYLPAELAQLAAEGWGGDAYVAIHDDALDRSAMVLVTTWDSESDADQFYNVMRQYGEARFASAAFSWETMTWESDQLHVSLARAASQVMWLFAPDAETAQALRAIIAIPMRQQ